MCARYSLYSDVMHLVQLYNLKNSVPFKANYNIAPSTKVPIICHLLNNEAHITLMRWGFVPHWVKEGETSSMIVNARSETIFEKPAFKNNILEQRCLFPTNGFYEWRTENGKKQPYLIRKKSQEPFLLGGIWSNKSAGDPFGMSCAIITKAANEMVNPFHERMPVIISPHQIDQWLEATSIKPFQIIPLLESSYPDDMEVVAVSKEVNKVTFNDPKAIEVLNDKEE